MGFIASGVEGAKRKQGEEKVYWEVSERRKLFFSFFFCGVQEVIHLAGLGVAQGWQAAGAWAILTGILCKIFFKAYDKLKWNCFCIIKVAKEGFTHCSWIS